MIRTSIQKQATDALVNSSLYGIIDVAPRVGKSKIAIEAIRDFAGSIMISVPYNSMIQAWKNEFKKWDMGKLCPCKL